ncbi:MAG: hypothetical protein SAJ11_22800, partial [Jaaginema sp. PMC 1078.18]|nr:hypothetical protein [Jaaginema sp. PMC 1078.18]
VGHFLMVVRLSDRHLIAIPLDEPPSLLAIPPPNIRPLATAQPHNRLLQLVSHVAVLAADKGSIEVFLLDLEKIGTQITL